MNTNDPTLYEKLHKQAIKNYIEQHDSFMQAQLDSVMISQEVSQDRGLRQIIRPMSALLKANNGEEEKGADRVQTMYSSVRPPIKNQKSGRGVEIAISIEEKKRAEDSQTQYYTTQFTGKTKNEED